MTVLIASTFGATKNYPDREMMAKTLGLFIESLRRQTDPGWRLFLSCHDVPLDFAIEERIHWCSLAPDAECDQTLIPEHYPKTLAEPIYYKKVGYGSKTTDMSRKTYNSVIEACRWAHRNSIRHFWLLRMDSDDLLAKDHVETLHKVGAMGAKAVFNRTCHMWDPKRSEFAIHRYPYSTTCNALLYEVDGEGLTPDWYYHCDDHTRFARRIVQDKIPYREVDYALCIITNSGNSISNRPEIDKERFTEKITLTEALKDRYGIKDF